MKRRLPSKDRKVLFADQLHLIAGLFFGLAFGVAGIGSAVLGKIADHTGIIAVFNACAYLPLIGLLTAGLPDVERARARQRDSG